ncbi:hypothetical protein B0H17DRAFT_1123895 [Mycena rosella]|uniref:Uncharacterized protein n=1 Tax=Mycena rosella TaxID=1033263 RepID=A0AAD7H2M4_MYCRO|nr:hypothetical protein B0H17DRAFT_1123895 [Mycena rosella]
MAPKSKYSKEQWDWITRWILEKAGGVLAKDENGVDERVARGAGSPLTPEQSAMLGEVVELRMAQLRNYFFNGYTKIRRQHGTGNSAQSLAAFLFKARPKGRRQHQLLEVFQKLNKVKVKAALRRSEYDSLNEVSLCRNEEGEWVDNEDNEARLKRVTNTRSQRMRVWRRVVQEVWDEEPDEVKEKIGALSKKELAVQPTPDEGENGEALERTPEEYQASIDESIQRTDAKSGGEFGSESLSTAVLGPTQQTHVNSITSVPFGATPDGRNFEQHHKDYKKGISNPLFRFLRKAIPTEVRLKRTIFSGEDKDQEEEEGEELPDPVLASTQPVKKSKSKSKSKSKVVAPVKDTEAVATPKPVRRPANSKSRAKAPGGVKAKSSAGRKAVASPVPSAGADSDGASADPVFAAVEPFVVDEHSSLSPMLFDSASSHGFDFSQMDDSFSPPDHAPSQIADFVQVDDAYNNFSLADNTLSQGDKLSQADEGAATVLRVPHAMCRRWRLCAALERSVPHLGAELISSRNDCKADLSREVYTKYCSSLCQMDRTSSTVSREKQQRRAIHRCRIHLQFGHQHRNKNQRCPRTGRAIPTLEQYALEVQRAGSFPARASELTERPVHMLDILRAIPAGVYDYSTYFRVVHCTPT